MVRALLAELSPEGRLDVRQGVGGTDCVKAVAVCIHELDAHPSAPNANFQWSTGTYLVFLRLS